MTLLHEYARIVNSQFGEDGVLEEIFRRFNALEGGRCIEVGAEDGRECSNTLYLRDRWAWRRLLIEADEVLYNRIEAHSLDTAVHSEIQATPSEGQTIDYWCDVTWGQDVGSPSLLVVDIDGNDYRVLENLRMRPRVIQAEFNQSIPWHLNITSPGFGTSLHALIDLMAVKGYHFIGATVCNAFFVWDKDDYLLFMDIERNPELYLDEKNFTYLVTSMYGGAVAFGPQTFGVQKRYAGEIDIIDPSGERQVVRLSHRSVRPQ